MEPVMPLAVLFFAALWAGCQNALAGGGSFLTLPALMLTGMDAPNSTSSANCLWQLRQSFMGHELTGLYLFLPTRLCITTARASERLYLSSKCLLRQNN